MKPLGSSCAGKLEAPPRIGLSPLGRYSSLGVRLHLSNAAPGSAALLLFGLSSKSWGQLGLPLALDPYGSGCDLLVAADVIVPIVTGSSGLERGHASIDMPMMARHRNLPLFGQWLTLGTGATWPGGLSAALTWQH